MGGRFEDVFMEIVTKFPTTEEFRKFARSCDGLVLKAHDINTVTENNKFSVNQQKLKLLALWKERNGNIATPESLIDLVTKYHQSQRDTVSSGERVEDVFHEVIEKIPPKEFKRFARSGNGLSLNQNKVAIIAEDNKGSFHEFEFQTLLAWKQIHSNTSDEDIILKIRQLTDEYLQNKEDPAKPVHEFSDDLKRRFTSFVRTLWLVQIFIKALQRRNESSDQEFIPMEIMANRQNLDTLDVEVSEPTMQNVKEDSQL